MPKMRLLPAVNFPLACNPLVHSFAFNYCVCHIVCDKTSNNQRSFNFEIQIPIPTLGSFEGQVYCFFVTLFFRSSSLFRFAVGVGWRKDCKIMGRFFVAAVDNPLRAILFGALVIFHCSFEAAAKPLCNWSFGSNRKFSSFPGLWTLDKLLPSWSTVISVEVFFKLC